MGRDLYGLKITSDIELLRNLPLCAKRGEVELYQLPSWLRSWVVKKSCHDQTLINECSISDYPSNFESL